LVPWMAVGEGYLNVGNVVEYLNYDNFSKISDSNYYLIFFFDPYCGHCRAFKLKFEEIARYLFPFVRCGKLDVTLDENIVITSTYDIEYVPIFFLFHNSNYTVDENPMIYKGDRDIFSIISWTLGNLPIMSLETNELSNYIISNSSIYPSRVFLFEDKDSNNFNEYFESYKIYQNDFIFSYIKYDPIIVSKLKSTSEKKLPLLIIKKALDSSEESIQYLELTKSSNKLHIHNFLINSLSSIQLNQHNKRKTIEPFISRRNFTILFFVLILFIIFRNKLKFLFLTIFRKKKKGTMLD